MPLVTQRAVKFVSLCMLFLILLVYQPGIALLENIHILLFVYILSPFFSFFSLNFWIFYQILPLCLCGIAHLGTVHSPICPFDQRIS